MTFYAIHVYENGTLYYQFTFGSASGYSTVTRVYSDFTEQLPLIPSWTYLRGFTVRCFKIVV